MDFAHRYGYRKVRDALQLESIDDKLKIKLWNLIDRYFISNLNKRYHKSRSKVDAICKHIWTEYLDRDVDTFLPFFNRLGPNFFQDVKSIFNAMEWYDVYVFLENLAKLDDPANGFYLGEFTYLVNEILEREQSGYRFVENQILKITSEEEVSSIENAIESDNTGLVSNHLETALSLLSNKEKPDYRNSMKESILAIEAMCSVIVGNPKATLGEALKVLENKHNLHPALKSSFGSLYGYTSDADGIRHKLKDGDQEVEYADALYMLVSCSAFINYLQSKYHN
ncbi:hypothetical protein MACH07_15710 [Flagellimonas marinaquae]|uniref:HEPN AbiJ-N-terminal domain-containing protein n=1 Tax=Flagellimonas marinaquae TaxID=254955 RepID=A0AA48H9C2_9FLAO|nr:hypothetical protein MACH07_15710 [Allomuricauda aquimarina]